MVPILLEVPCTRCHAQGAIQYYRIVKAAGFAESSFLALFNRRAHAACSSQAKHSGINKYRQARRHVSQPGM